MQYEPVLQELPGMIQLTVSYCKFGSEFKYRKNTHIWTNDKKLAKLLPPQCTVSNLCQWAAENGGKHPVSVRGGDHCVGHGLSAKERLWEKYRQPGGFWARVFRFTEDQVVKVQTVGNAEESERESDTMSLPESVSPSSVSDEG